MTNKYKPLIPSVVEQLRQAGEEFELLTIRDTAANAQWIQNNFPIAFSGIDWSKMPDSVCIQHGHDSKLVAAFEEIVTKRELGGSLIISWTNGRTLAIKISMEVLRKYAEDILFEESNTWICNEQDRWCIEQYHEGYICFGRCRTAR